MRAKFVIQSETAGFFFGIAGKWARHPIGATWFDSYDEADTVARREFSREDVTVKQLTEDRHGVVE